MVTEQRFSVVNDEDKNIFFYCTPVLEMEDTEDTIPAWLEGSIDHVTLYTFGNLE